MKMNDLTIFFCIFVIHFRIGTFFINTSYTWGQRYRNFITNLQFANNRIAEATLSAPLLLPKTDTNLFSLNPKEIKGLSTQGSGID
jgi:hypothetical protein